MSRRCGRVTSSNFYALAMLYGIVFAVMLLVLDSIVHAGLFVAVQF